MINDDRIILINYPSGGFGNFVYHILTEYSTNTHKVDNSNFHLSTSGNSHSGVKYTPVWSKDPNDYVLPKIETDNKLLILCDNGIDNDSIVKISQKFKSHKIIRLCIDQEIRPVIFKTYTTKSLDRTVYDEVSEQVNNYWSDAAEEYAVRENFTLFYHNWPFKWEPLADSSVINVSIQKLIDNPIDTLKNLIINIGGSVINKKSFENLCKEWLKSNQRYFQIYKSWKSIEQALDNEEDYDLTSITDLHDQGYINYCIEKKYKITIRVRDYMNWFKTTNDIKKMINDDKLIN